MTRWYEDLAEGEVFPLGSHSFTEAEIVRFGKLYDPQYFHVDPEAAKAGPFGGIVASGWHTAAAGHRLMVDALDAEAVRLRALGQEPGVSGPSPGVNAAEFKAPVRPGDTISYTLTVTGKRASASLPGWGVLLNDMRATNQRGELVYRAELVSFTKRRDYKMPLRLWALLALSRLPGLGGLARRR
jgi:acyl dehydratase